MVARLHGLDGPGSNKVMRMGEKTATAMMATEL
jgi:hypothetical protein